MATTVQVMARLSGDAKGMVGAYREAREAASKHSKETADSSRNAADAVKGFATKAAAALGGVAVAWAGMNAALNSQASEGMLMAKLGISPKEAKAAAKVAGGVYAEGWGESLDEVTGATATVKRALGGVGGNGAVKKVTKQALALSKTFGLDVVESMKAAQTMVKTGLSPSVQEAYKLIASGAQKGLNANGDLLETMNEYGTQFEKLGLTGKTAMGLISQGMKAGARDTDYVADAIKEFSIRAIDGSKLTQESFQAIGLDAGKMAQQIAKGGPAAQKGLGTVLDKLRKVEDPARRSQIAVGLFGTKAEDLGKALYALDPSTAAKGLGDVGKSMKSVMEGTKKTISPIKQMKRAFETGLGIIAELALPAVNGLKKIAPPIIEGARQIKEWISGTAVPALQALGNWFAENKGTIGAFAAVITALLIPTFITLGITAMTSAKKQVTAWALSSGGAIKAAAVYVVQSYVVVGSWIRMGVAGMASAFKAIAAWVIHKAQAVAGAAVYTVQSLRVAAAWVAMSAAAVASGIKTKAVWVGTVVASAVAGAASFAKQAARVVGAWALMGVKALLHAAKMAAAWFIALGPIGWVIAAVVGLVALVIANWDKISKWTKKAWKAVVQWVKDAVQNVKRWVTDVFGQVKQTAIRIWNGIVNWVKSIPGKFMDAIRGLARLNYRMAQYILRAKDAVVAKFLSVVNWVKGVPGRILRALGNLGRLLWSAGGDIMRGLLNGITGAIGGVVRAAKNAASAVLGGIKSFFGIASPSKVMAKMGDFLMQGLTRGIDRQANRAANAMRRAAKRVKGQAKFGNPQVKISTNLQEPAGATGAGWRPPGPPPAAGAATAGGSAPVQQVTVHQYNPVAQSSSKVLESNADLFTAAARGI